MNPPRRPQASLLKVGAMPYSSGVFSLGREIAGDLASLVPHTALEAIRAVACSNAITGTLLDDMMQASYDNPHYLFLLAQRRKWQAAHDEADVLGQLASYADHSRDLGGLLGAACHLVTIDRCVTKGAKLTRVVGIIPAACAPAKDFHEAVSEVLGPLLRVVR